MPKIPEACINSVYKQVQTKSAKKSPKNRLISGSWGLQGNAAHRKSLPSVSADLPPVFHVFNVYFI